jgi:hypothetical protein
VSSIVWLIVISLASYGLWYTVGRGKISEGFRNRLNVGHPMLIAMLECPGCFGFWTGLVLLISTKLVAWPVDYLQLLMLPFTIVATNRLLHGIATFGDRNDHAASGLGN